MLHLRFDVMGATQLNRALSRFGDDIRDFRPVWQQIRLDFFKIEEQQFKSEGARGGSPWVPLKPTYAAWKAVHFPGRKLLELTGEMRQQLTTGQGMIVQIQPLSLRLTPTLPRALWHQRGTGRMPARMVVVLTEADKVRWVRMLHEYVENAAKKGGLSR